MNWEQAIYVGGPLDGLVKDIHPKASSSMFPHDGVAHRYKLDGDKDNPNRDAKGRRVMRHEQARIAKPCKPDTGA